MNLEEKPYQLTTFKSIITCGFSFFWRGCILVSPLLLGLILPFMEGPALLVTASNEVSLTQGLKIRLSVESIDLCLVFQPDFYS